MAGSAGTDLVADVRKVGFISPPGWFDITPTEFLRVAPQGTVVMQTQMRLPDFDYSIEHIVEAASEVEACARSLAAARPDVVAQFGYPFSWAHGWEGALRLRERVEEAIARPFVMMGVVAVEAVRALGCVSVSVACGYYTETWIQGLCAFLQGAGLDVALAENWEAQGVITPGARGTFVGSKDVDPMGWALPSAPVEQAVRIGARRAPRADCVLVAGGGARLLDMAERLESEVKRPIVAGELALYWGILRALGVQRPVGGHGRLLASLG